MSSISDDRRASAVIRDAAMELFAEIGAAEVTVRQVAAAAGVSPGLVMHHFGSKDGLKEAVDKRVAGFVDEMLAELERVGEEGGAVTLAEMLASRLGQQPAIAGYMRRTLVDPGEAGDDLFDRLYEVTVAALRKLVGAGVARPSADEAARAAFLLVNDLAVVLLRRRIERVLGADPLGRQGLQRWGTTAIEIYMGGLFAAGVRRHADGRDGWQVMNNAIETAGLTKTYGSTRAVDDLTLEVPAGQVFAFLGPNGAGKTTTIRLMLDLQRATSGRATVLGLDSHRDGVEVHRRVGYLPGELVLYPRLTGRRHIEGFARARGLTDLAFADQLVERLDVVVDRPVRDLSKGNRQKIGLVLAFMARPELLVLDEPTTGLDPLKQREFEGLLRETVAEGRTVFLSSHELDEVQRVAERVAIIRQGRLVAVDTVAGLAGPMPRRMEVRFREPVRPSVFEALDGVRVETCEDGHVTLEIDGDIGPVLRVVADHEPLEVVSRHADLDELFLDFYGDADQKAGADAR